MILSLKDIAFKLLKNNKFIVISSIVSIMLAVTLIVNLFVLAENAEISLEQEIQKQYGAMDISVGYNSDSAKIISKQMIEKIDSLPYINNVSKVLIGKLNIDYGNSQDFMVYSVGVQNDFLSKSKYKYTKDILTNEVILNQGLAEGLRKSEGDQINVNGRSLKIIEIIDNIQQDSAMPDMLIANHATLQSLLNDGKEATYVMLKLSDKSRNLEVANELQKIDRDFRVDIAEEQEFMKTNIANLKTFQIFLSILILIISSLLVLSNFQIFLYNYRNQFALIRALGGSSGQAFKLVFIQCTFINIIGIILAFAISYISCSYLLDLFNNLFSFKASSIKFPYITAGLVSCASFLIIELFMLIPAIKSSKILPLRIMQSNEEIAINYKYSKRWGISILILAGTVLVSAIVRKNSGDSMLLGVIASILLTVGIYILFMYYLKQILGFFLPAIKIIGGNASFVAIKNLIPQVKNNGPIIIAISTMIIISVFGGNTFKTLKINDESFLRQQYPADIVVTDRNKLDSKLDSSFKSDLDKLQGVKHTSILSDGSMFVQTEKGLRPLRYSLANLEPMVQAGLIPRIDGDIRTTIVVTKAFANENHLAVGDIIYIKPRAHDGEPNTAVDTKNGFKGISIGAIVDKVPAISYDQALIDWSNEGFNGETGVFLKALVMTDNQDATMKDLKLLRQKYPSIKWGTLTQALEESEQIFYQRWAFFIVFLVIIFCALFLGIFNILMNNMVTKRKEYAILRTLELDKKGMIKVLLTQALVFILVGVILGCLLGMAITLVLSFAEHGYLSINVQYQLTSIIISVLILLTIFIFTPFAINLANKKISEEIKI
jgi:ABC-type antimicrobial peptide transport system permease subunit